MSAYLRALRKWEQPSHSVALVNGLPLARMSVLSALYDVKRDRSDIFTVRLSQDILEHGDEFPFHLMRNLAQELTSREGLSPELDSLATEYLRPFEISEKTRKAGFSLRFSVSREDKLRRREKYAEDVRRDCETCFVRIVEDLQWKPILLIDSIENLSSSSKHFLVQFLVRHGEQSVTVLSGGEEIALSAFVRDQGISKDHGVAFVKQDADLDTRTTFREDQAVSSHRALELGSIITNAFNTESRRFNYLKFEERFYVAPSDCVSRVLPFDFCILGHLRMREDYPTLIRTDYDCALIIKVADEPVADSSLLTAINEGAYKILIDGISPGRGSRFEPWDSFVFLAAPGISEAIVQGYQHLPYRNLFVLLPDGSFRNLSPHKWMDHILNKAARRWAKREGRGLPAGSTS